MSTIKPPLKKIREVVTEIDFEYNIVQLSESVKDLAEQYPECTVERNDDRHYLVRYRAETAEEYRKRIELSEQFEIRKMEKEKAEYERLKKIFECNHGNL